MAKKLLTIAAITIAIGGTVFYLYHRQYENLSVPPPIGTATATPQVLESSIGVTVVLPYKALAQRANAATPRKFSGSGKGPDKCVAHLFGHCNLHVGTKYDYNVVRGSIGVSQGPNNTIRVSVPIKISGHGGFRGTGADLTKLRAKRFEARLLAYADIGFSVTPNWCPQPTAHAGFQWIKGARVEIVGGVWVGISGHIQKSLRAAIQNMGNQAAASLNCDAVRRQIQSVWMARAYPLSLKDVKSPLFLDVTPDSFGYSGLRTTQTSARLDFRLNAKLSVTDVDHRPREIALPAVQTIAFAPGVVHLAVPVVVSYESIVRLLQNRLGGHTFKLATAGGIAKITPNAFKIYPTRKGVAFGVRIDATLPKRWLDVRGWVYLSAQPIVGNSGQSIRFANVTFTRSLDNPLWSVLSAMLKTEIESRIADAASVDLKQPLSDAKEAVAQELANPIHGVAILLTEPNVRVGRIVAAKDALFVEGIWKSGASIRLTGDSAHEMEKNRSPTNRAL